LFTKSPAKTTSSSSKDEYAFLDEINKSTTHSSAEKKKKKKSGVMGGLLKTGEFGEIYMDKDDGDDWDDVDGYRGYDDEYVSSAEKKKNKKKSQQQHARGSNLDNNGEVVSNLDDSRDDDDDYVGNEEEEDRDYEGDDNDDDEVDNILKNEFESKWTLTDFLKSPADAAFNDVVAAYLIHFGQKKAELRELGEMETEDELIAETTKLMATFIKESLLEYLLRKVSELELVFPSHSQNLSGHSELIRISTPTLDFVKFTTAVLGLDSVHCDLVASVRRTLLTQIKVREFSPEGQFASPCPSFMLRDVICIFCNNCQDVDLLRDNMYNEESMDDRWYISPGGGNSSSKSPQKLQDGSTAQAAQSIESVISRAASRKWICNSNGCVCEIDKSEVENRLLQLVETLSVTYMIQDLRCPRTFRTTTSLCSAMSESSLPLALDFSYTNLRRQLMIMSLVSVRHGFSLLHNTIQEMLHQHK
jgi:hypothetical protein